MPNVTWEVPSLTGGVSRQPATQRFRNQVEEANNVLLDISRGAEKRAGTEFIKVGTTSNGQIDASDSTKYAEHWINRDSTNRYLVLIDDTLAAADRVQVFNALTGVKQTVSITADAQTYLTTGGGVDAKDKFVLISVADTTFILNKEATTALSGSAITHTGQDGNNLNDWTTTVSNTHKTSYKDFAFPPTPGGAGTKWYAEDDSAGQPAGFYEVVGTTREPFYKRIRTEEANYTPSPTTMPIKMTLSGGTWTVDVITWNDRLSGNSTTNPGPSFIGKKIRDITFHDNRLWFFADEQVVSSQLGDFYNLWIDNVANLVDSDPIDVQLSGSSVNKISFAIPFSKSLILSTDGSRQFEVKSDTGLTPTSVNVIASTSYSVYNKCRPVTVGKQMYFITTDSTKSQLWEYAYSDAYILNIASDVSKHVDGYLPPNLNRMVAVEAKDTLFMYVRDSNIMYGYRMFWQQDQKAQSAFFKWEFDGDNDILGATIYDDYMYILFRRDSKLWIEKVCVDTPANDSGLVFSVRLDRKQTLTGVYAAGETTWTLPHGDASIDTIVLGSAFGDSTGSVIQIEHDASPTTLVLDGDYSAGPVFVGRPYSAEVELGEQVYRDSNGKPIEGTLILLRMRSRHLNSGGYSVLVEPIRRDIRTYEYTPFRLDGISALTDTVNIVSSGFFDCKPFVECATGTITLSNSEPTPSIWVSCTMDGRFVPSKSDPTV